MAIYYWSALQNEANINFDPTQDQLIFDAGIDSHLQLSNWNLSLPTWNIPTAFSTFTDLSGKTVTLTGLGPSNITPNNLQFLGSDARFFTGDQGPGATDDGLAYAITGSAGNDVIVGFNGNDTLNGGDGDDLIYLRFTDPMMMMSPVAQDIIDGGAGTDWYLMDPGYSQTISANLTLGRAYFGASASQFSTLTSIEGIGGAQGADKLIGNAQDNFFRGRQGDDKIFGRGGVDWVYYNESDALGGLDVDLDARIAYDDGFGGLDDLVDIENVRGGFFDDLIVGSNVNNTLWGETGNDTLVGGSGSDTLRGGLGDDLLNGALEDGSTDSNFFYYGGPIYLNVADYADAADSVTVSLAVSGQQNTGGAGTDTLLHMDGLIGGQFADHLTGNVRANSLSGADGNDSLYGGVGNDTLEGGAGDDLIDGGSGTDTARYNNAGAGITVNLGLGGAQNTGGNGVDTLVSIENLIGSAFNDVLAGSAFANRIDGGNGNDIMNGASGNDWLQGGAGNDVINGGLGIDTASYAEALSGVTINLNISTNQNTGGAGIDRLIGIENVEGSAFDDVLTAHVSGSKLFGGNGNNFFLGGAGNDVLAGTYANGNYNYEASAINTVSYAGATGGVTVSLNNGSSSQNIGGGQGFDTLTNINRLIGSNFDDVFTTGYSGGQHLEGGAGNDRMVVDQGYAEYTLDGGSGVDTLALGNYFNNINGMTLDLGSTEAQFYESGTAVGSMTLSGFENAMGSWGKDHITGTTGNNILEGSKGDDTLDGGTGIDTLSYANSQNIYYQIIPDPVTFTNRMIGITISLAITTAQNTGTEHGIDTVTGFENLIGTLADDVLTGNASSNTIEGGAGNDTISGGAGLDTASYASAGSSVTVNLSLTGIQSTGGAGNDTLIDMERLLGSDFNDQLTGNNADNWLTGGLGADQLTGAGGSDQFLYGSMLQSQAFGAYDTITDFSTAQNDKINLLLIDANTTVAGNQAFSFIGTEAFSAAGQVRFEAGTVYANVDANLGADLQIELTGVGSLTATSFVL
jgi:Ca2+-binding RTX toxin-like protein